jgi:hypothetical protein
VTSRMMSPPCSVERASESYRRFLDESAKAERRLASLELRLQEALQELARLRETMDDERPS